MVVSPRPCSLHSQSGTTLCVDRLVYSCRLMWFPDSEQGFQLVKYEMQDLDASIAGDQPCSHPKSHAGANTGRVYINATYDCSQRRQPHLPKSTSAPVEYRTKRSLGTASKALGSDAKLAGRGRGCLGSLFSIEMATLF